MELKSNWRVIGRNSIWSSPWPPALSLCACNRRFRSATSALVPATLSGRPEADMARAMAAAFAEVEAPTAAEVLNRLRMVFPLAPLSARLAALAVTMDRLCHSF